MKTLRPSLVSGLLLCLSVSACAAQQHSSDLVISSDPELVEIASQLLPDLAMRSGMQLKRPVRLERRSREELVRYLRSKLDEELPPEDARATVDSYALLGLVPPDLDLRKVLLALYTEQVAGFYEPDSTALFVMDDQPRSSLESLLMHELVHAIQDQNVDLDSLTDPKLGNDRTIAAQAAIEGQATLVMLEFMTERMAGAPVDLGDIPDFASRMRPVLEGLRAQFPALASAPPVIQESLLFPYVEGTAYVQKLWSGDERIAPFGDYLPLSTEEVLERNSDDPPVELALAVQGARVVYEDVLGRLEIGVLLDEDLGSGSARFADGWDGDRYALVETDDGARGLLWCSVWSDTAARDRFAEALERALPLMGAPAAVERLEVAQRPATLLRIGSLGAVSVGVEAARGT